MNKKALLGLAAWTFSQVVAAQTYGFDCITDINAANCAAGTSQLQVTVSGTSVSQALFTFTNVGTAALSLADVYFDDGTLLAIATIANGAGVSFSQGGFAIEPSRRHRDRIQRHGRLQRRRRPPGSTQRRQSR